MSQPRRPSPVRRRAIRSAILLDELVGDAPDGDHRGDRHAALPRRAEAGVDRGVGREVEVGVGKHHHVVLRAAQGLHALAVRGAGLVDVPGDGRGADERHRLDVGVFEQPVDGDLVAVEDVEHAVGRPASAHSRASHSAADGTFSLGLSTTVLPAAMAIGKNHIGTMAGKLNGLMTATTPSGWRIEDTSTRVEAFSVNPPLSRCGMPQANSTTSWPRATSPRASASTLPCSAVMSSASSPARALSSSRKRNTIWVRRASEVSRHAGNAAFAAATAASTSALGQGQAGGDPPVAGSVTSEKRSPEPSWSAPATQWCRARTVESARLRDACGDNRRRGTSVAERARPKSRYDLSPSLTSRLTQ